MWSSYSDPVLRHSTVDISALLSGSASEHAVTIPLSKSSTMAHSSVVCARKCPSDEHDTGGASVGAGDGIAVGAWVGENVFEPTTALTALCVTSSN